MQQQRMFSTDQVTQILMKEFNEFCYVNKTLTAGEISALTRYVLLLITQINNVQTNNA